MYSCYYDVHGIYMYMYMLEVDFSVGVNIPLQNDLATN